jgi:hypothetical protein
MAVAATSCAALVVAAIPTLCYTDFLNIPPPIFLVTKPAPGIYCNTCEASLRQHLEMKFQVYLNKLFLHHLFLEMLKVHCQIYLLIATVFRNYYF